MRGPYLIGVGVIMALVAGALWYVFQRDDTVEPVPSSQVEAATQSTDETARAETDQPDDAEADGNALAVEEEAAASQQLDYEVRPRTAEEERGGVSAADAGLPAPTFDIVRINPRGDSVIAGRAAPGAEVVVRDDGEVIGRAKADRNGEWVMVPERPLAPGTRELDLLETLPDSGVEVASDDVVILVVPEPTQGQGERQLAEDGANGKQDQPLAVLVPREAPDGGQILQRSANGEGVDQGPLSLEIIEYDDKGDVNFSGRASEGDEVRVYLDNKLVDVAKPDQADDGVWKATPTERSARGSMFCALISLTRKGR